MTHGEHENDKVIGRNVARIRQGRGLTQVKFGQMIGVSFQQIAKYESGENRISGSRFCLITNALKVSIDILFEGTDVYTKSYVFPHSQEKPPHFRAMRGILRETKA